MAYNDSGELPVSQSTYSLGGYTFELKVQTVHEPGEEDVVSVFAICRGPDGTRETQAVDYPASTTVENWSVECNETEASVYVTTKEHGAATLKPGSPTASAGEEFAVLRHYIFGDRHYTCENASSPPLAGIIATTDGGRRWWNPGLIGPDSSLVTKVSGEHSGAMPAVVLGTYNGVLFYYAGGAGLMPDEWGGGRNEILSGVQLGNFEPSAETYEYLINTYFDFEGQESEKLVARFAIDIREADTGGWDEPGDDGPPGTTLYVTVTGATAGSCTGTPADNETVKGYGDGGNGGYGGGGGAGASTVIIYEFATGLADSVSQEAISRGPGTGGPGGKGGKGGDGCILIFY